MVPWRRKANKFLLWLLDGPVWWSGLALVAAGAYLLGFWSAAPTSMRIFLVFGVSLLFFRPRLALILIGVFSIAALGQAPTDPVAIVGFLLTALGMLWIISRLSQVQHYRKVAQQDLSRCPVCGYDYTKTGDLCPECGTNVPEYMERVRKAVK